VGELGGGVEMLGLAVDVGPPSGDGGPPQENADTAIAMNAKITAGFRVAERIVIIIDRC
jgi:hypothetical protein